MELFDRTFISRSPAGRLWKLPLWDKKNNSGQKGVAKEPKGIFGEEANEQNDDDVPP